MSLIRWVLALRQCPDDATQRWLQLYALYKMSGLRLYCDVPSNDAYWWADRFDNMYTRARNNGNNREIDMAYSALAWDMGDR
jgi:hypothetical protein